MQLPLDVVESFPRQLTLVEDKIVGVGLGVLDGKQAPPSPSAEIMHVKYD